MSICVISGLISKPIFDTKLISIDWQSILNTELQQTVALYDRITSSVWAVDPASPALDITLPGDGFDPASGQTFVTVAGGTDGATYYINNAITTSGVSLNGVSTPVQTFIRQLRLRGQC